MPSRYSGVVGRNGTERKALTGQVGTAGSVDLVSSALVVWNVRSLIGRDSEEASVLEQKVSLSNPETLCDRSVASVAAVCDGELKLSVSSNVSLLTAWHGCVERQSIAWEVEAEDCAGGPVVVDRDLRDVWGVGRGVLVEPEGRAVGGDRGVLNVATGADGNTAEVDGLLAALAGLERWQSCCRCGEGECDEGLHFGCVGDYLEDCDEVRCKVCLV